MSDIVVVSEERLRAVIREELQQIQPQEAQEEHTWWTLRQCAERKGISYDVLRKLPVRYRPNFGRCTTMIDGSRKYKEVYHVSTVLPWLDKTHEEIDREYRTWIRKMGGEIRGDKKKAVAGTTANGKTRENRELMS